jgi:hypothetical protein
MSHYCRICSSYLANERFSGKGHKTHICRKCQQLPREQREAIEAKSEIHDFLFRQSHVSAKNIQRLRLHCSSTNPNIKLLAEAVLAAASVAPYKRKRFAILRLDAPQVIEQLAAVGLIDNNREYSEVDEFLHLTE